MKNHDEGRKVDSPHVNMLDTEPLPEDPRIIEVVEEYLSQLESGKTPDRSEFIRRYPELATAIAQCLDGLELVHGGLDSRSGKLAKSGISRSIFHGDRLPNPLGDFQVVRELARGGMGVVYEAIQLSLGRPVALKVLPFTAAFDARQLQRFKNEAQAAALLHHTNIVPIYAVGCERGVHFYAMQLIEGVSLAEIIRQLRKQEKRSPSPDEKSEPSIDSSQVLTEPRSHSEPPQANTLNSTLHISVAMTSGGSPTNVSYFRKVSYLMVQAATALDHAHQQGVIHRDVKPANLLVNSNGNLWVTDFGLAQFQADNGLTRSGDLLGTVRYMSPEQTSGRRTMLDHRTDIYSLGATFFELLTLEPVFPGETRQELIYQILNQEPRSPRALNRAVPPELETIVLKALGKHPVDRYPTATDFAADIQRYLDNQPIMARRPSWLERMRKWSRRHPSMVAAAVLTLAVIAVASLVTNWMIAREQQRTETARRSEELRANEAEMRFQQAREAVDVLIEVSEDELFDKPMAQGTRKRLLQTALSYYEDFIEQRRGDVVSQAELALVQGRVRGILYELDLLQRESQVGLLWRSSVKEDLMLTEDQKAKLSDFLRQLSEEQSAASMQLANATEQSEDTRRRRFVAMAESHERSLAAIIKPEQRRRLKQISIQTQGIFAFKDPEIIEILRLTPEQIASIRAIERQIFSRGPNKEHVPRGPNMKEHELHGSNTKGHELHSSNTKEHEPGSGDRHWRPHLSREESVAKVIALLDAEQAKRWNEMIGPKFAGADNHFFHGSPGGKPPMSPPRSRDSRRSESRPSGEDPPMPPVRPDDE